MKFLTFLNFGCINICKNMLISAEKVGINMDDFFIACLDTESLDELKQYKNAFLYLDQNIKEYQDWTIEDRTGFRNIVKYKWKLINDIYKNNPNLVWVDTDIVFKKNPIEYLEGNQKVLFQSDHPGAHICTGFMVFNDTPECKNLVEECGRYDGEDDQLLANRVILSKYSSYIEILSKELFPNGYVYHKESSKSSKKNAIIVHNNWIKGLTNKILKFKQEGLWHLSNATDNGLNSNSVRKYIYIPHEFSGFGAIIDRKIVTSRIADEYGRIPIFLNQGWPYDDPYQYEYELFPFDYYSPGGGLESPTAVFDYTNQEDKIVVFDTNHWIHNFMHESFKKRKVYEDGKILSSFKLKEIYQKVVNDTLEKIPQIYDSISLHIRRGDKNDPNQEPFPYYTEIDDYVNACVKVAEQYGYSSVYINSDSLFAIQEAYNKLTNLGFSCCYDEEQQRYDVNKNLNPDNKISSSQNPNIAKQETITSIKVIYTMSKSKHVIGMNNVQFAKLASYLLVYNSDAKLGYTWLDCKNKGKTFSYSIV